MIKAVIFDIDGVLIDSFEANLKFFQDLMVKAGYKPPTRKEYATLFHLSMFDVIKTLTKLSSDEKTQEIWEMGKSRAVEYPHHLLVVTKGVEKTLGTLSKNYVLGIVTNRVKEGIYEIPALLKLKKYFSATIAYQDTKNHKPHPEPLLLICERLNVDPKMAVYIGDAEIDIAAGKDAGMKTILFSKTIAGSPDLSTQNFQEIPSLVKKLNS